MISRIPNTVKYIHFNPEKPENHNMYISNLKSGYAHTYNGKRWNTVKKDGFMQEIVEIYEMMINGWENDPNMQEIYPGIENNSVDMTAPDKKSNNEKIMEELELTLYNNKDMVLETIKRLGLK